MSNVVKMYDYRIRLRFSYTKDGVTSGLLCRLCMNSHHRHGQLMDITDLLLAAKPSAPLELDDLLIRNGSNSPFNFEDETLPTNLIFSRCSECGVDQFGRACLKSDVSKIADDLSLLTVSDPAATSSKAVAKDNLDTMLIQDMKLACCRGPFLDGTHNEDKALGGMHLKTILSELREKLRYQCYEFGKKLDAVCNSRKWLARNCTVCTAVEANQSFFDHILSESHLHNMSSQGLFLTMAEYHVLNNILERTKRCLMYRNDNTLIGIRAPFLNGQCHPPNHHVGLVSDDVLKARIQLFRETSKLISQDCIYTGVSVIIPYSYLRRCSHCEVELNRAKYLSHVLSEEHIAKVGSLNRHFYNEDIGLMACLIRFCALLFEDDDYCKILKDDKDNVKPPPFYLGYNPTDVTDAMSLDEAVDFAKSTEGDEFYLMYAADELKDMGYRIRGLHCEHCNKSTRSKGNSMVHITSAQHIRQVMSDGMVFSRANDRDLLLAASSKAKKILEKRRKKLQASRRTEQTSRYADSRRPPPPRDRPTTEPKQPRPQKAAEPLPSKEVQPALLVKRTLRLRKPAKPSPPKELKPAPSVESKASLAENPDSHPVKAKRAPHPPKANRPRSSKKSVPNPSKEALPSTLEKSVSSVPDA